ncbi:MAG: hypothetical protein CMH15_14250 [Mesonia sp.]|nr:hypothetical protein [Mesonia sp.]MAQ42178.1 hypothetical protein [Mesonia sp.]MBJ97952.1 hypothetical protein [Flavobacteriaceae bacterium]
MDWENEWMENCKYYQIPLILIHTKKRQAKVYSSITPYTFGSVDMIKFVLIASGSKKFNFLIKIIGVFL